MSIQPQNKPNCALRAKQIMRLWKGIRSEERRRKAAREETADTAEQPEINGDDGEERMEGLRQRLKREGRLFGCELSEEMMDDAADKWEW